MKGKAFRKRGAQVDKKNEGRQKKENRGEGEWSEAKQGTIGSLSVGQRHVTLAWVISSILGHREQGKVEIDDSL